MKSAGKWNLAEKIAFGAFLFWVAAGLIFTIGHITPRHVEMWRLPEWLRRFVDLCLSTGDPILILLAFINTHLHAARQWGAGPARKWGLILLVCAFGIEWCGAATGFPFGRYTYTNRFGPMLGIVPLTIPLAWHIVVTNALFVVRLVGANLTRFVQAMLTGMACTLYDVVLEPFATVEKHYWLWRQGTIPVTNYVAWFVLSSALVFLFAPAASRRIKLDVRPVAILALTVAIFIAGEIKL